ncbi:hypothetical protein MKX01_023269 [Papaver californicum]|nr:hypothetical protein MKX01_023269 [Papaver californicum]
MEKSSGIEPHPMNGGTGQHSYVQNSSLQRRGLDLSQGMIKEAIAKEFNVQNQLMNNPNTTFRIVDLGCSVGTNSLIAVNAIIEAMDLKFESYFRGPELKKTATPEFQVYFNDIASNDFNTLFASIPLEALLCSRCTGFILRTFVSSSFPSFH